MIKITLLLIFIILFFTILSNYIKNKKNDKNEKNINLEHFQDNEVIEVDDGFNDYDKIYKELVEKNKKRDKKLNTDFNPDISSNPNNEYLLDYKDEGIYNSIPFKFNSRDINFNEDIGVLKNIRKVPFLNSYSEEINFDELNIILNNIEIKKFIKLEKKDNIDKELYKNIANTIISEINKQFVKLKLENIKHLYDKRKYELFSYSLILDELIENKSSDNKNIILNISFFKLLKDQYYTIQLNCNYSYINNVIQINQLDILGLNKEEDITFVDIKKPEQKYCLLDDNNLKENKFHSKYSEKFNFNKLVKCHDEKLVNNQLSLDLFKKEFDENQVKNFLNKKKEMYEQAEEDKKYKCFLKDGFNESTCKSYSLSDKTSGVFDKPCNSNEECPFYKKNKNYENSRGGCVKGYCEMPLNIERIGYKVYYSKDKPFCHNCNRKDCLGDDCFTCCEEQKDENKYINLKSPDYMFSNDGR